MQVWKTGKPLIVTDPEQMHPRARAEGIQATIVLPLRSETETLGALFISYRHPRIFADREVELFTLFANQAALAVKRVRLMDETRQRMAELEAVNKVSTVLRAAQTLDEMLPLFLDEARAVLNADAATIWLYDAARGELHQAAARGFPEITAPLAAGKGIAGRVFATGEPYVTREFKTDPLTSEAMRPQVPAGLGGVGIPIRTAHEVVGVLFASVRLPRELTAVETHLLTTLAEIAGNAIHRMSLHEQTEQRLRQVQSPHTVDVAITASLDLQMTLNVLLEHVTTQLGVDAADVLLFSPRTQMLEYAVGRGFRSRAMERLRLRLGEGLAGRVVLERRMIADSRWQMADSKWQIADGSPSAISHPPSAIGYQPSAISQEGFVAYYGVPLIAKGQVYGVLEIFHRAPLHPDADWMYFLESLANQAAIAIDNGRLFDNLQRSNIELTLAYDTTIEGWSRALELRDQETEGHALRVSDLTVRLARAMDIGDDALVHVRRGALLHDIGKMAVPDAILLKPGPLTDDEWAVMRRHPQFSYDLLSPIAYLRLALDIPYCHHEKWDGTGYPRGLKGEQIPLAARIFAVVDVWDALSSNRPYRAAWPENQVMEYIRDQTGKHFDPRVVEMFLRMTRDER